MSTGVNPRPYRSTTRAEAASATRVRIVAAARGLLVDRGYAATPVADIARVAGVSVDTVYASVGRKPRLVLAVVDDLLGEGKGPVPAEERGYVVALRRAPDAETKLRVYAAAMGRLLMEVGPLLRALARAGEDDPECAQAWREIDERRARNMMTLAADLRTTGELRPELADTDVATLIWSTNSWEYRDLLARRGVDGERYARFLGDLWVRALVAPKAGPQEKSD